ncbi:hypothetical protein [Paenibacillus daejeonensis]|uniref:hypothetical protein n=1 Tax=Paenibacillus daejeonensis TaxID=135193 RepID=UPI0003812AAC|nr:hypothetical protein [Paenibacillus daejeonensis]
MKRIRRWWLPGLIVLLCVIAVVPVTTGPPDRTRMVVDHTLETYIAPPCFDQAEATNYLGEINWRGAQTYNYKPESACTTALMEPQSMMLWQVAGVRLGWLSGPWGW